VTAELAEVLQRALAHEPEKRFASVGAFGDALAAAPAVGLRLHVAGGRAPDAPRSQAGASAPPTPGSSSDLAWHAQGKPTHARRAWVLGLLVTLGLGAGAAALWRGTSGAAQDKTTIPTAAAVPAAPAARLPDAGVALEIDASSPDAATSARAAVAIPEAAPPPPVPVPPSKHVPARRSRRPTESAPKPSKKPDPATDRDAILKI
jgi:hypothetical protein